MPKISIIMPVYNKQDHLKKSLNSVLIQDFLDFELIAVDDGSTDASLSILEDYKEKDPRIKVFHTDNHGVSHARNMGLDNSEGKWIQFLDSDDLIEKEYLQYSHDILLEQDPDILFTSFTKIDEDGKTLSLIEVPVIGKQDGKDLLASFIEYQHKNGFYGYISNKLIRKNLLLQANARFNEQLKLAEDLDFYLQLYPEVKSVWYLERNSFSYLQTQDNYSNNPDIDYLGQLSIQKRIRQWVINSGSYGIYKDVVDAFVCRYAAYAVFDAAMRGEDIVSVCNVLLRDDIVVSCLNKEYVTNTVHKRIITALKNNEIKQLKMYLEARETIKRIFGRQ